MGPGAQDNVRASRWDERVVGQTGWEHMGIPYISADMSVMFGNYHQ